MVSMPAEWVDWIVIREDLRQRWHHEYQWSRLTSAVSSRCRVRTIITTAPPMSDSASMAADLRSAGWPAWCSVSVHIRRETALKPGYCRNAGHNPAPPGPGGGHRCPGRAGRMRRQRERRRRDGQAVGPASDPALRAGLLCPPRRRCVGHAGTGVGAHQLHPVRSVAQRRRARRHRCHFRARPLHPGHRLGRQPPGGRDRLHDHQLGSPASGQRHPRGGVGRASREVDLAPPR
jgi:hypothetical protein